MNKNGNTSIFKLIISFAKIGVMTFGGGYAMLPMLEREVVDKRGWVTSDELMNCYAVAQCTPGIIAVNTATYVGYKERGISGGIFATVGIVLPSFLIIALLASVISMFKDNPYVVKAFMGIRIAVCALITSSLIKMIKKSVSSLATATVAAMSFLLQLFLKVSPIVITLYVIAFGISVYFIKARRRGEGK